MKMHSVVSVLAVILIVGIGFVGCEQGAPTGAEDMSADGDMDITTLTKGGASTSYDANAGTGMWAGFNESTDNPTYGSTSFGLWAGKTGDAGSVTITNDASYLYVTYQTNGTADLGEVHVYVWTSTSAIPGSRPAPGQTPWKAENINAGSYTMAIPVDVACGSTFYVSAHAALVGDGDGGSSSNAGQTAYAGSNPFVNGKGAWWGYVTYTVDCFYDIDVNVSFQGDCSGDVAVVLEGSTLQPEYANGTWSFNNMPAGVYTVTVTTTAHVVENTFTRQVSIGPDASESFTFVCVTTPPPPPPPSGEGCSLSQGYWFAKPGTQWTNTVTLGGYSYTEGQGDLIQSFNGPGVNQNLKHAFTQAATILLSAQNGWVSPTASVWQHVAIIDTYLQSLNAPMSPTLLLTVSSIPANVQQAAGNIGNWVDANHCPESYE